MSFGRDGEPAGLSVFRQDGKGRVIPGGMRIVEQRGEGSPCEPIRGGQAGEFDERRIEIEKLDDARTADAAFLSRGGQEHCRRSGVFVQDVLAPPTAALAEQIAVVADQHDDGVVPQPQAIQTVEHGAELRVHEADAGEIAAERFAMIVGRWWRFDAGDRRSAGHRQRHVGGRIEIEPALRRQAR